MKKIATSVLTMIACFILMQNLNAGANKELRMATTFISKETKQCEIIKKHSFSRQDREDTFKLIFNCENPEDTVSFQIIGFSGKIIYGKKFLGFSFYDYGRPWYMYVTDPKRGKDFDAKKLSSQVADSLHKADLLYINKRMNEFFNLDRFVVNPIMKLDKKHLNVFHYDGISGDATVIGFKIQLYAEGFEMIAYSKKEQEVQFIALAD